MNSLKSLSRRKKYAVVILLSILVISSILISGPLLDRQRALNTLDMKINEVMSEYHVPGVAACAIKNGNVVWMKTYGYADLEQNITVTEDTLFMQGSVSKIVTGIAFMQLFERGFIDLDDDINDYLPFEVVNPNHPSIAITPRMLLSHVSSIHDSDDILQPMVFNGRDSPLSLEIFIQGYLLPNGTYYQSTNWNDAKPGTEYDYSNVGATLIAYLVEVLSNTDFEEYCQHNIFIPLGMNETSWFLANLDTDSIAIPYLYVGSNFIAQEHCGHAFYPAGFMRTSVRQQARLLIALMEGGTCGDTKILNESTLQLMMTLHYPDIVDNYGLFFTNSEVLWGHSGGAIGVAARTFFYPEAHEGVIIMMNLKDYTALNDIHNHILEGMRAAYGWLT